MIRKTAAGIMVSIEDLIRIDREAKSEGYIDEIEFCDKLIFLANSNKVRSENIASIIGRMNKRLSGR